MGAKRRQFTREFKSEAVHQVTEGGQSVAAVALMLGIRPDMLRAWKRQVEGLPRDAGKNVFSGHGKGTGPESELKRLRREVERLEQERDFFEYIEIWYNRQRRHSSLDYLSPLQYEQRLLSSAA